ncbi:hypothetical protein PJI17_11825 [Mycobacterium kansasii]
MTLWVVPLDPAGAAASMAWLSAPSVAAYAGPGNFGDGCSLGLVAASAVLSSNGLPPAEAAAESAGQIRGSRRCIPARQWRRCRCSSADACPGNRSGVNTLATP